MTTTEAGLIDDARRSIEACGQKVAEILAMTERGTAKASSALDDLSAAHDSLAHLRDWITDPGRDEPF